MSLIARIALALLVSTLVHGALIGLAAGVFAPPVPEIELKSPSEVEFGFADTALQAANIADAPPAQEAAAEPAPEPQEVAAAPVEKPKKKRRRRRPVPDAGVPDPAQADGGQSVAARATDAGSSRERDGGTSPEPGPPIVASRNGAQVSLRVNVAALRAAPQAAEYAALISAMPDVRALLSGSDIEPMRDLDRLWVASPDMSRERAAVAGRYLGGQDLARKAAEKLGAQAGIEVRFTRLQGVPTAPWVSPDGTPRVLALLGDQNFVVARRSDLRAVLAVGSHLAGGAASAEDLSRGLLGITGDAIAQFDVEGAHHFIAAPAGQAPRRIAAFVHPLGAGALRLESRAEFSDVTGAQRVESELRKLISTYASHPLVGLMGLRHAARSVEVTREGHRLTVKAELNTGEVRALLVAARDSMPAPAPRAPTPQPGVTQPRASSPSP